MRITKIQQTSQRKILSTAHDDYTKGLNSYAFFKVNSHSTGEDLVQDTFKKTWNYILKGGKIATMKSFLYHILNNPIIDEYRRRKHQTSSLDQLIEKGFEPNDDDSERIFNILDGKIALLLVDKLPIHYRTVMHMKYVQNMSISEIALKTKETKNNVAVQLYRGLQKLRVLYEHS